MKTFKNRVLSGAMAGVLALSMAVPAFAAGNTPAASTTPNMKTEISGSYEAPNIDVVVPTTGTVVINPYGLGTTVTKSGGSKVTLTGQVMSAPLAVKNKTTMWLSVGATATAVLPEGATMKLAAATTAGTPNLQEGDTGYVAPATGKSAFVQLEVVQAPASVTGAEGTSLEDAIIDASADADNWADSGKLTVTAKGAEGSALATLKPATMDNNGAFASYSAGSVGLFRLSGDCTSGPKAAWAETDTFQVNVVFNFSPTSAPSHAIDYQGLTGVVTPTVVSGKEGETVTITIKGASGKTYDANCTVEDADGNDLSPTITGASGADEITVSFTMPSSDVVIEGSFS